MNRKLNITAFAILFALSCFGVYNWYTQPKIAFVYNHKLLEQYEGVKDSRKLYQQKEQEYQSNLDTLEKELTVLVKDYQLNFTNYQDKDKQLKETIIKKKQADFYQYKTFVQSETAKENERLTASVLNQINEFIVEYSKDHGYDYVFGTTSDGSLFYSKEKNDITEEVLEALNKKYRGEK
jgi:outer membrane protein